MRHALITGTGSGLGAAMATRLVSEGWRVTGIDRIAAPDDRTILADLGDRAAVDRVLGELLSMGPFDLVVLNAGISATGHFERIPVAAHLNVLAVNAEAPLILAHGLAAGGALARGGALVFVSSLSHFTGYPGAASYGASKDVVAVYAKSLRKPLKTIGVSVTLACPGPLRTGQAERHAPPGSDEDQRMAPDKAARIILDAARRGRFLVVPGLAPRLTSLAARLAPGCATRVMRRLIYDRLVRDLW